MMAVQSRTRSPARGRSTSKSAIWTEADLRRVQQQHQARPVVEPPYGPGLYLTLDLSSSTGWAYGGLDHYAPLTGVWHLPKSTPGARYAAYENELIDALAKWRPKAVIMEAPMRLYAQVAKRGKETAARQQYGLAAYTEGECWRARVKCLQADVNEVRQTVLGRSRWPDSDQVKPWIVAWCEARGWTVPDHNAADASVLWEFVCGKARARRRSTGMAA
jgi:hypothetical protein